MYTYVFFLVKPTPRHALVAAANAGMQMNTCKSKIMPPRDAASRASSSRDERSDALLEHRHRQRRPTMQGHGLAGQTHTEHERRP